MNKIIIIAGPTASGKSALSIDIAKKLNSQIVSSDSMQIYKDMDIGTAKITVDEMSNIKHHMIDIVNPQDDYSVADYADNAIKIIDDMLKNNLIPIICGGTGLYIDSILYPLSMGVKDDTIREKLYSEYEAHGATYMHDKLKAIDSQEAEKVHENNVKRVLRALEIYEISGKIKSDINDRKDLRYDTCLIVISPNKADLYEQIDKRVDEMFSNGLETEVKALLNKGCTFDCQSMQAIGYKEFKNYFDGVYTIDQVKDEIKKNTRHYAKRQVTWFKRYPFAHFVLSNKDEKINEIINDFIKE